MKIFYPIGAFYPSQLGGPNNTVYWMTKALTQHNIDISIITTHRGIQPNSNIKFNKWLDLGYGRIKYLRVLHRLIPFQVCLNSIRPIFKSDIVHLTSLFYSGSLILSLVSILFKKKIVWSVRGELDEAALSYKRQIKNILLNIISLLKSRVIFHGTSEEEILLIKKRFGQNTQTINIPNYMELPMLQLRDIDQKYFIYLGRIHKIKALDLLLQGLALSESFMKSNYHLKLVGDHRNDFGKELSTLTERLHLNKKVKFEGFVDDNDLKQKLLSNAHYLILPSHSENFGNVVIEALAQGTPVIASKGTPWKGLVLREAGYWIENTSDAIGATINKCLQLSNEDYNQMRTNALKYVQEEYSIDNNVSSWIDAYSNC